VVALGLQGVDGVLGVARAGGGGVCGCGQSEDGCGQSASGEGATVNFFILCASLVGRVLSLMVGRPRSRR
jgi:hypothetical protein